MIRVKLCRDSRWASRSASLQICGIPRRALRCAEGVLSTSVRSVCRSFQSFIQRKSQFLNSISLSLSFSFSFCPLTQQKNALKIFLSLTLCALCQSFQIDDSCLVFFIFTDGHGHAAHHSENHHKQRTRVFTARLSVARLRR